MQAITNLFAKITFYWSVFTLVSGFVVSCFWTGFKVRMAEFRLMAALLNKDKP